jgi:AhpC/TSA family protein
MRRAALWIIVSLCGCTARGLDLDDKATDPLASADVVALVFTATDCPVANRYAPDLARLAERWRAQGVALWLIYPDDDATAVRAHQADYRLAALPALRDPRHALVRAAAATVTPEVAVYRRRTRIYLGRIDDRAVGFARERPAPTTHELDDAIAAAVAGRPPPVATAPAFGCAIGDPP